MNRKVSLIVIDPMMDSKREVRMSQLFGWNDPDKLVNAFIADMQYASYGLVDYHISERILVDDFLPMEDEFRYTPEEFIRCWRGRGGFHQPDRVKYSFILSTKYGPSVILMPAFMSRGWEVQEHSGVTLRR